MPLKVEPLTEKQKKNLPPALQKAILNKRKQKAFVSAELRPTLRVSEAIKEKKVKKMETGGFVSAGSTVPTIKVKGEDLRTQYERAAGKKMKILPVYPQVKLMKKGGEVKKMALGGMALFNAPYKNKYLQEKFKKN